MSMPKLDLRHLQLVRAIAEEGSVTRAGLRLHLTQSALSHQLRDAEERLGVRLFERVGRRLLLAPAGERLLRSARTVLEELERAEEEVGRKGTARSLIRLESNHPLFERQNIALNEFTIHKKETSSMITIHTYLNGEYLNSYWADGIIISTPTGSTGYSLSCGGPIVVPQSENLVITPIAPHNLNVRPIIVSDKNVISLEVEGRSQHFMATLDSRSETIDSTYQVAIRKESYSVNLIRFSNENFLRTLRSKLNWGLDSRN